MGYMEKLAVEKKAVKALYDKGMENLTDDEANELKNHFEEAKRLQERVDLFKGVNDLNADDVKPEAKTAPAAKTLGDLYAQELKKAGMTVIGTKAHPFASSEFKAATDMHVAGTGTAGTGYQPVVTQIDMNGVWPYERPLVVADLFGSVTLSGNANTVEYPVYGALEGGAGTVGEGGAKPQTHLPAPRWESDSLKEVAAWWKVTDNMAEDLSYIVSEINNHARYNLQLLEETQLLSGNGSDANIKGLLSRDIQKMVQDTDSDPDRIFKARTKIALATGFRADALVINPPTTSHSPLQGRERPVLRRRLLQRPVRQRHHHAGPAAVGSQDRGHRGHRPGTVLVGAFKLGGAVIRKGGLRAESTTPTPTISPTISSRSACANASACRSSIRRRSSRSHWEKPRSDA